MYIELHAASAFSFLQGASLPETLVERAAALGYTALALLDANGVYGAPRFHKAAKQAGLRAIDRKSTLLNSSHLVISYAVFCLKKKNKTQHRMQNDAQ